MYLCNLNIPIWYKPDFESEWINNYSSSKEANLEVADGPVRLCNLDLNAN